MKLFEIIKFLQETRLLYKVYNAENLEISMITDDSRKVVPGSLFVCKGALFKKEYLEDAIKKGAVCYLADKDFGVNITAVLTRDILKAFAAVSAVFYNFPTKSIKTVAVTGTKGKTTTAEMLRTVLSVSHHAAAIGTNGVDTTKKLYDNNLTTPESLYINAYLREACDNDADFAVLETSAQAFKMHRTDFLEFHVGVFTNFGLDHIGPKEHPDEEDYFKCKMKMFSQCRAAVIYGDDDKFHRILPYVSHISYLTFGFSDKNDFYATDIKSDGSFIYFTLCSKYLQGEFKLSMLGDFNVLNALATIATCFLLGISKEDMVLALQRIFVSGRMEIFKAADRIVIVDYAHNKLSYERLLNTVKEEFPNRRIVSVFGCPGTKALNRRKDMGELAAKYSDFTVITAEDPDTEPTEVTMSEIASYLDKTGAEYVKIADRKEAIEFAVNNSKQGDVVLILGKGNEKTMMYDGKFLPHEGDSDIAARVIKNFN